jgi:hypothetical protein
MLANRIGTTFEGTAIHIQAGAVLAALIRIAVGIGGAADGQTLIALADLARAAVCILQALHAEPTG